MKGIFTTPDAPGDSELMAWIEANRDHRGDECLIWPFSTARSGYGSFTRNGKCFYVHRYMCEYANGPAPSARPFAAHSCGRGQFGCVNPRHLIWKTNSQNQLDRHGHGATFSNVLTPIQVDEIIQTKDTISARAAAAQFNVSETTVRQIRAGKTWGSKKRYRYFSPEERASIAAKLRTSSISKLAKEFGCGRTIITRMRRAATLNQGE